jgi:FkbM family methyltransferase
LKFLAFSLDSFSSLLLIEKRFQLDDAMLSYAQNMEDVVLAKIFEGQKTGFYIDVGGGHAIADNVSYLFYERGWHGLVVEPQAQLGNLYRQVRPKDILISRLLGREEGSLELFEAAVFHGLSTASKSHAEAAKKAGIAGTFIKKPVTTLAKIAADHAPGTIDFLKIDVEGHEAEVLAGNDWKRFRPRVILVEAVEPITNEDSSQRFEPAILAENYRFAFNDNLNRWYVSEKEAEKLLPLFPKSPVPWDSVQHLGEYGPAHQDTTHPDHALALQLVKKFLAGLPAMDKATLQKLGVDKADPASLARIASLFDGGYIVD